VYSGYCVETGEPGDFPAKDNSQGYRVYQSCGHGRIDNWNFGTSLSVSNTMSAAYVDLGTLAQIYARYNILNLDYGSVFESIHWDEKGNGSGLVIAKDGTAQAFQPFLATDISNLTTVGSSAYITPPQKGHVYLVRLCNGNCVSWDQTELYYKIIALNEASPFTIRWNVFYTNFVIPRTDEEPAGLLSSDDKAKAALGLAITVFIFFVFGLVYLIWKRRNAGKVSNDLGAVNTSSTTDYQGMS